MIKDIITHSFRGDAGRREIGYSVPLSAKATEALAIIASFQLMTKVEIAKPPRRGRGCSADALNERCGIETVASVADEAENAIRSVNMRWSAYPSLP